MNKYHKQCICMILTAALLAAGSHITWSGKTVVAHAEEYKNTEKEDAIENIVETVAGVKKLDHDAFDKEETVYVISDSSGNPTEVIASEWLKNLKGSAEIEDKSGLKDIKNVKGYEAFRKGKDGTLTWEADGNDIYYQGTPENELPLAVHVTYKLNGKELSPEEIKGKSGRVEIRFDYENNTEEKINVDGKNEDVSVPFTMLTGVILPNETFSNVEVENARLISEGNNAIVIGYAFPGLYSSLKYDEFKNNLDEDQREKAEELDIPDHVTITAYAENFELNSTLTVALPDVLQDVSFTDNIDTDKVKDDMDDLADASQELMDGTSDLLDGVYDLKDGTSELKDGTSEIKDGTQDIKDGTADILDGSADLMDGAEDMREGACEAYSGTKKLYKGAKKLKTGAGDAYDGSKQLNSGVKQVADLLGSNAGSLQQLQQIAAILAASMNTGTSSGFGSSGMSSNPQSASLLQTRLIQMETANERAAASVSMLSLSRSFDTVSEDETADEDGDEEETTWETIKLLRKTASANNAMYGSIVSLNEFIISKIEELKAEKEDLSGRLEEMEENGEPEPDMEPEEPEENTLSADAVKDYYADYYVSAFQEYSETLKDYYDEYYKFENRIDAIDELLEILGNLQESLGTISVSADDAAKLLSDSAERMTEQMAETDDGNHESDEEDGEGGDTGEEESDVETAVINNMINANITNIEAADAVWSVVDELQNMDLISSSMIRNGRLGEPQALPDFSKMTQEEIADYILHNPDEAPAAVGQALQTADNATRVKVSAVVLDLANKGAIDPASAAWKNIVHAAGQISSAAVSQGITTLTNTLTSPSAKQSLGKLTAGAGSLMDGLGTLYNGTKELKDGVYDLRDGMSELSNGGVKLYNGTVDLHDGAKDLDDGAGDLDEGAKDLDDGAQELDDGVGELVDGVQELHDGVIEFNDEGIQKLIDLFGDNVTDMLDRLDAIKKTGAGYQSFSGKRDDMEGSVKFILKTDEIKDDD